MILDIFLILVIILSLFFLVKIIFSKFLLLSKIDISQVKKEEEWGKKIYLFKKRFLDYFKKIDLKKPLVNLFQKRFKKIKEHFINLENKYLERQKEIIRRKPLISEKRIEKLFKEGSKLLDKKIFIQAEKKFVEIVSFDPRNLNALKNLLEIYLYQKNFSRAKEISKYILELNKQAIKWWQKFRVKEEKIPIELIEEITSSFTNLGIIYQEIGENAKAIGCFRKALEFMPNNPRTLDFLIENSIILKRKEIAERYLGKIREINPENQKIEEWEEKIKEIG